jgi:hypothetical protein
MRIVVLFRTIGVITILVWLYALWRCIAMFSRQELVLSILSTAQTCFVICAAAFLLVRRRRGVAVVLIFASLLPAYFVAHKLWSVLTYPGAIPQLLYQRQAWLWVAWMGLFAVTPLCWIRLLLRFERIEDRRDLTMRSS